MTIQDLKNLIASKVVGQGSAIDAGSVLPEILYGIVELIEEGGGDVTAEQIKKALGYTPADENNVKPSAPLSDVSNILDWDSELVNPEKIIDEQVLRGAAKEFNDTIIKKEADYRWGTYNPILVNPYKLTDSNFSDVLESIDFRNGLGDFIKIGTLNSKNMRKHYRDNTRPFYFQLFEQNSSYATLCPAGAHRNSPIVESGRSYYVIAAIDDYPIVRNSIYQHYTLKFFFDFLDEDSADVYVQGFNYSDFARYSVAKKDFLAVSGDPFFDLAGTGGNYKLELLRIGKMVYMTGAIKCIKDMPYEGNWDLFYIPSAFRPKRGFTWVQMGNQWHDNKTAEYYVSVGSEGKVAMEKFSIAGINAIPVKDKTYFVTGQWYLI